MKQRKTIIFLGIIILISICIGGIAFTLFLQRQNDKYIKTAEENDISRYEWIEMLCEQSGLTEYQNEEPYYKDVNISNAYFPYIQSAVEWDVLVSDTKFEGDGYASGRFIALTAMKTIGERKLGFYLDTGNAITDDIYIELAIEHELIEEKQLTEGFTIEECKQVLENLKGLYFSEFWKDDYTNITYQDGVIELSSDDVLQSNMDGSEVVVIDNVRNTLETGTVIVFEQENTKLKFAREIDGIDADGTLSLNPAELDQVVESLTVSDITELTFEDIVNYYKVEENTYAVNNLERQQADEKLINTKVFPIDINSKGFKISLSTEGEQNDKHLEIQVTDNSTGVTKALPINYKVEQDSEYSVEINIDKILIGGQVSYEVLHGGLQYIDIAVDVDSTFKGTIKAEEEKKVPLLKTPVSFGNGIAGVDIQIYLVLSMEGEISFEAELPMEVSLYFEKDRGFRNFRHDILPKNPKVEANCDAEAVFRFEPTVFILCCVNIVDAEADIGVTASAKVTTHPTAQVCADVSISFPVITISVCGDDEADTIIGDMGLSAEWKIYSADKEEDRALFQAPFQLKLHFERLSDKTVQFVEKCTYSEEKSMGDDDKPNPDETVQMNNTYFTRYKEITGIDRPVFCFDYPDGWTISREEVRIEHSDNPFMPQYMEYYDEIVELTNERGVRITYTQYNMDPGLVGSGSVFNYTVDYEVEKVKDSSLKLAHISSSGRLMVAKIKGLGGTDPEGSSFDGDSVSYALMLNDKEGTQTTNLPGYYGMCSFYYPEWNSFQVESADGFLYAINPYTFIAEASYGGFTKGEEKEVIEILQSFREVN